MKRNDARYRWVIAAQHNARAEPGAGSCIFLHVWQNANTPTAGCTAMPDMAMERLIHWLDADAKPIFALLTRQGYAQLQRPWQLPAVDNTAAL